MRTIEHVVSAEEDGRRLSSIVTRVMGVSRGCYSSLKFKGGALVNGKPARADCRVRKGDVVTVAFADGDARPLAPYPLPLTIPHEDEDLFVIDKPAPLPCIRSVRQNGQTLENALYAYLGEPRDFVYRPINRLDKGTSGLMLIAKNAHIQHLMQAQLHTPRFVRRYEAIVEGAPPEDEGVVDLPIAIERAGGVKRVARADGKPSATRYRVLERAGGRTLVSLLLETGRTHQIRVHMADIGCPIVGDYLYGREEDALPGRFALHAAAVEFYHPLKKEAVALRSPLPDALRRLL